MYDLGVAVYFALLITQSTPAVLGPYKNIKFLNTKCMRRAFKCVSDKGKL